MIILWREHAPVLLGLLLLVGTAPSAQAQIEPTAIEVIPDSTLNTIVTPTDPNTVTITGGTIAGANLFHSFDRFSVRTGQTVDFANPTTVQSILTRVSGSLPSDIDGLIRTNGTASLFFLNPNGITFGPNARLAVNGSFFATTAPGWQFADGQRFSVQPQSAELLSVTIPIGPQLGNRGPILQRSPNLQVPSGQTLALLGSDVRLEGGSLTVDSGRILLDSTGDLTLSNGSQINANGVGGGRVDLRGQTVLLSNSKILALTFGDRDGQGIAIQADRVRLQDAAQVSSLTLGSGRGGDLDIRARESVEVQGPGAENFQQLVVRFFQSGTFTGVNPSIMLNASSFGRGNAGNITISGDRVLVDNGAVVVSTTLQSGTGGGLTLRGREVNVRGAAIATGTLRNSVGNGGPILIEGDRFTLQDGGAVVSTTFGDGSSGEVRLNVAQEILLDGSPPGSVLQTVVSSNSIGGQGRGGTIAIDTQRLRVFGGAGISASSGGIIAGKLLPPIGGPSGDLTIRATEFIELSGVSEPLADGRRLASYLAAGSLTPNPSGSLDITTPRLVVSNGGLISTATLGLGQGGNLTITADRVEVIGDPFSPFVSRIEASSGQAFNAINRVATADAGTLIFRVQDLQIREGGAVTVENLGSGMAGNIDVTAKTVTLDGQARINAQTGSGGGGNVNLQAETLLLRRGSRIQTDAQRSDGGNIQINAKFIAAVPEENSDITANAIQGRGGTIQITTEGLFGLAFRPQLTAWSDITASSQQGLNGNVQITTVDTAPDRLPAELPNTLVDATRQMTQACVDQARHNRLLITGRGGLPPTPEEQLNGIVGWEDPSGMTASTATESPTIVEASHWIRDRQGHLHLVATPTAHTSIGDADCQTEPMANRSGGTVR